MIRFIFLFFPFAFSLTSPIFANAKLQDVDISLKTSTVSLTISQKANEQGPKKSRLKKLFELGEDLGMTYQLYSTDLGYEFPLVPHENGMRCSLKYWVDKDIIRLSLSIPTGDIEPTDPLLTTTASNTINFRGTSAEHLYTLLKDTYGGESGRFSDVKILDETIRCIQHNFRGDISYSCTFTL